MIPHLGTEGLTSEQDIQGLETQIRKRMVVESVRHGLTLPYEGGAYGRVAQLADGFESSWRHPAFTGKIADLADHDTGFKYHSGKVSTSTVETVCALGECGDEGIALLHNTVVEFYTGLLNKLDETGKIGLINDEESYAANLAMVRLAEAYEKGDYYPADMRGLVEVIREFVNRGEEVCEALSYLPEQIGLKHLWTAALQSSATKDIAWRTTLGACHVDTVVEAKPGRKTQGHKDKINGLTNELFEAANASTFLTPEQTVFLSDYAFTCRLDRNQYDFFHPDVFLSVMESNLEDPTRLPGWWTDEIAHLFSKEGVATGFYDLINKYPTRFNDFFPLLFSGINWCPEAELNKITSSLRQRFIDQPLLIKEAETFSCLHKWEEAKGDTSRFLCWAEYFGPDMAIHLSSDHYKTRESAPENLLSIAKIYEKDLRHGVAGDAQAAAVWLPISGERLLQTFADGNQAISFAGNMILGVEGQARSMNVTDSLQGVLATIHTHLHISEVTKAAVHIRGLYSVLNQEVPDYKGVTHEDMVKLMSNSEIRSKMDMIKNQCCPEFGQEKYLKHLRMAVDLTRSLETQTKYYGEQTFMHLLDKIATKLTADISPQLVLELSRQINGYTGKHRGYLLPVILALREYVLDRGIAVDPEELDAAQWQECAVHLAAFTGELSLSTLYMLKRLHKSDPERSMALMMKDLGESYAKLNEAEKKFRLAFGANLEGSVDDFRSLTSRSLVDWLYRSVQDELLNIEQ